MNKPLKSSGTKVKRAFVPDALRGMGHQVRTTYRLFMRLMEVRLAEFDITPAQWFFIKALLDGDGVSQGELSSRVGTMENTTVAALRTLERRRLIVRRRDIVDQRKINIFLTEQGRALKGKIQPIVHELNDTAIGKMPEREVQLAKLLLVKIQNNLLASLSEMNENLPGKRPRRSDIPKSPRQFAGSVQNGTVVRNIPD